MDPVVVSLVGLGVLVLAIFLITRQMKLKDAYEGVVRDKNMQTHEDAEGDTSEWYYLHVELVDGKVAKKQVSKKVYEQISVGDRVIKEAGKMDPVKV